MSASVQPIAPADAAASSGLAPAELSKLRKAAGDFEAMALGEFLKPMFDTVDTANNPFGGGPGEDAWRPMFIDTIGKQLAAHGGIGIAAAAFQQMLRDQENAAQATETAP